VRRVTRTLVDVVDRQQRASCAFTTTNMKVAARVVATSVAVNQVATAYRQKRGSARRSRGGRKQYGPAESAGAAATYAQTIGDAFISTYGYILVREKAQMLYVVMRIEPSAVDITMMEGYYSELRGCRSYRLYAPARHVTRRCRIGDTVLSFVWHSPCSPS